MMIHCTWIVQSRPADERTCLFQLSAETRAVWLFIERTLVYSGEEEDGGREEMR